ncbi:MAG: flavodoxin family protein [Desulfobacterota bacterium]|nr:flavodoxin family protein [Thermodesulfobacteriota bacterium]
MKILGICGSYREQSNTNKLVKRIAEASGKPFELVYLGKLDIRPCTGCGMCMMQEGQCPIQDDMQQLYDKLLGADALIFGAPTYFMDISGAMKCFIDRCMALFYREVGPPYHPDMPWLGNRPHAGKPAVTVTTVAGAGHERSKETLKVAVDDCMKMKLVAELAEVVGMNDVDDMPEVLKRADEAGKKLGQALGG